MLEALSWGAILLTLTGTLVLISERGFRDGWRAAWFLALLAVPAWLGITFRSIRLDPPLMVALATLIVALFRPFQGFSTHATLSDGLLAAMVGAFVLSDALTRTLIPGTLIELLKMWVFPYLLGRMFVSQASESGRHFRLLCWVSMVVAVSAIIEAVSKVNVLAQATGMHWDLLETSEGFRWGLKRAQATTNHPIYFGLLVALMLPWLLVAARAALTGHGPLWWVAVPALSFVAAFVTVSRSAQLAVLGVLASDIFFRRPHYRTPMVFFGIVLGMAFWIFRDEALDLLGQYAGENAPGNDIVVIDGIEEIYTGTRHRDLLFKAYKDGIAGAGWVGYGTNLRDMPIEANMDGRFASIDNHYLHYFLRHGYLGIGSFLAFTLCTAYQLARVAWSRTHPDATLASGLCGAFIMVAIMLRGVAFSGDFGSLWLFVAGMGAGWFAQLPSQATMDSPSEGGVK